MFNHLSFELTLHAKSFGDMNETYVITFHLEVIFHIEAKRIHRGKYDDLSFSKRGPTFHEPLKFSCVFFLYECLKFHPTKRHHYSFFPPLFTRSFPATNFLLKAAHCNKICLNGLNATWHMTCLFFDPQLLTPGKNT